MTGILPSPHLSLCLNLRKRTSVFQLNYGTHIDSAKSLGLQQKEPLFCSKFRMLEPGAQLGEHGDQLPERYELHGEPAGQILGREAKGGGKMGSSSKPSLQGK